MRVQPLLPHQLGQGRREAVGGGWGARGQAVTDLLSVPIQGRGCAGLWARRCLLTRGLRGRDLCKTHFPR